MNRQFEESPIQSSIKRYYSSEENLTRKLLLREDDLEYDWRKDGKIGLLMDFGYGFMEIKYCNKIRTRNQDPVHKSFWRTAGSTFMVKLRRRQYSVEDSDNPGYRCCCRTCHVTTGGVAIAVTQFIFVLLYAIRGLVFLIRGEPDFVGVGALSLGLSAAALLILAQLAMGIVCLVYISVGRRNLLTAIGATDYDPADLEAYEMRRFIEIIVYCVMAVYFAGAALGCWFAYVMVYCLVYFKDRERSRREEKAVARSPGVDGAEVENQPLTDAGQQTSCPLCPPPNSHLEIYLSPQGPSWETDIL
uniref:Uncharacterized protein n=1 Tax=Romanomermis culicivorax TaxID=13658 RepID=A0A915KT11_ROMCU